ncbi:MAG: hypothetical protein ABIO77_07810 [Ginsengibacter sp.]
MDDKAKKSEKENEESLKELERTNPGTTHSTDPQENMEGPISSLMHGIGESFDDKDAEKKKESRDKSD